MSNQESQEEISTVESLSKIFSSIEESSSVCENNAEVAHDQSVNPSPSDFMDVRRYLQDLNYSLGDSQIETALVRAKPVAVVLKEEHIFRLTGQTVAGQDVFACPFDPIKFVEIFPLSMGMDSVVLDATNDLDDPVFLTEFARRLSVFGLYRLAPDSLVSKTAHEFLGAEWAYAHELEEVSWSLDGSTPITFHKGDGVPRVRFYYVSEVE